jgi:D-cysteine desulfhydrase
MRIPKNTVLANLPTPLQKLKFDGKNFLLKRDDFTGSDLSGNKVRKLEYLLHQAKREKAEIIFTCGGDQSNHARATAAAAAKLGLKTRLFLWGKEKMNPEGNLFLDKMYGSDIIYLNKNDFNNVDEIMTEERRKMVRNGKRVYVIPAGGSTTLGIWGYISFINEIKKQIEIKKINGIFSACGSGGTAAGLLVGAALNNLDLKIYAVNVLIPKKEIKKKILQLALGASLEYKLDINLDETKLEIVDGYSKEGYKNIDPAKVKLINRFARSSGILLDPAYTGKAFKAYYDKILNKSRGLKVIFIHTGGLFGAFAKQKQYLAHIVNK